MQAVTVSEYGAAPTVTEVPDPKVGPGQILIGVRAAGMNPMDHSIASGGWASRMPAVFPMVLGVDLAGVVEARGPQASRFSPGDDVYGHLVIPPLGSTGTFSRQVAVTQDAPLARLPAGLDDTIAASLPTTGCTALQLVEPLGSLAGKTVLVVGAAGGVGSFVTQLASQAGGHIIASARADDDSRVRAYGADETVDYTAVPLPEAVSKAHPEGINVLIDVASDRDQFAALASMVVPGGSAATTKYVADVDSLAKVGVTGINFQVDFSEDRLEHLADAVTSGRMVPPPVTTVKLGDVPGIWAKSAGKVVVIP
jgi:NADPH:quinone reductase-like Zn-dependent oxidoreductase